MITSMDTLNLRKSGVDPLFSLKTFHSFSYFFILFHTISSEIRGIIIMSESRKGIPPLSGFFYFSKKEGDDCGSDDGKAADVL